ncbi:MULTISPECIES: type II toxin-antitoxin system PemK/MazF family toxin [Brochothrix]|uniref:mRNA interferase n=1 Tax=Brochothrix thermosphacta TaxID=2756 RepID=A0A1D2LP07_BROTH|nr:MULTISPECIES: type II toxin-antitoxin system PemK/MazF family toxin [Brochothrix]SLN00384.1 Programmed cell death toxin YdcE [Brachybacterium faecium]ANZ94548.1 PemK family transcriptional regulator [Brochothrix thermosphacta]ANZ97141.1 PemK family transcriptional regulator [Brochothrix thermosphacta]ATF26582.1 type II toxin-antitoxin system PemK/MazF family toxin [Brochothrix thermosphacta]ATH85937.1 type II toxin-antitoxin system PemK/MazF family toxin [Brochothrix thermosphacta]
MIRRGEIYYADLSPVKGSEQGGIRPVLIIQNDIGNKFSPTVIVAAVTAKIQKAKLLTHVEVKSSKKGLNKNSVILLEQIRTIDKQRLTDRVTVLDKKVMKEVDNSLKISLSLVTF